MSATQWVHINLGQGQSDAVAAKIMPAGIFEQVINGDLDQAGALTVRNGFSPLTMQSYKGPMQAYDLYSVDESLVALGSDERSVPHSLFVYTNDVAVNPWRDIVHPSLFAGVLGATEVQRVGGDPYRAALILHASLAINTAGLLCTAVSSIIGANSEGTLHIFNPDNDETFYLTTDSSPSPAPRAVVALGTSFGLLRMAATNTLQLRTQSTTAVPTSATFGTVTGTLVSDLQPSSGFVATSDATRIHLLYRRTSDGAVVYAQFNHAGAQQGTTKVILAADNGGACFAMVADATEVSAIVSTGLAATTATLLTWGISSPFTTSAGPTTVTFTSIINNLSITRVQTRDILINGNHQTGMQMFLRNSAHTAQLSQTYDTAFSMAGDVALAGDHAIVSAQHAWGTPPDENTMCVLDFGKIGSFAPNGRSRSVAWYEDRTIARPTLGGGRDGFNVASFNGWTYVFQGFRDQNQSDNIVLRRAKFGSTTRRQGFYLGGLFYLVGGQPMVMDMAQPAESGMPVPRIIATLQSTTGNLTQQGLYKYRAVYEWLDIKGNLHLSPVSTEAAIQLTGVNDDVSVVVSTPPSLRVGTQGAATSTGVKVSLYRTETNVTTTPARLRIPNTNFAPGDLAVRTMLLSINGGANDDVVFSADSVSADSIGQRMVANIAGIRYEVDTQGNLDIFTTLEGAGATILVADISSAGALLGLATGQTGTPGTTTAAAGEIFFFATSAIVPSATDFGASITVLDTTSDAVLITHAPLYTTGDRGAVSGVLDFAPPLPATYATLTRDRIWFAGSRELIQVSQKSFPNEAIAFVETNLVGPVGFSYQARVPGRITGISAVDERVIIGTRDKLYITGGDGPNYVGIGEFEVPIELPSEVGFYNVFGNVLTSEGLWFPADVDKLYLLPRGGGAPAWAGEPVKNRMGGFISGAAVTEGLTPRAVFAVGDAARMLVRDATSKQWFEYALPATPARGVIEHRGQFYFIDGSGAVWAQTAFSDNGAVIPLQVKFGTAAPFGPNAQGRLRVIQLLGEFKSAADVKLEVSYDDGVSYEDCGTHTVTGLSADAAVRLQWFPATQRGDRFKPRLTMTPATVGQGITFNVLSLGVIPSKGETKLQAGLRK